MVDYNDNSPYVCTCNYYVIVYACKLYITSLLQDL